jgi:hypothetical protein
MFGDAYSEGSALDSSQLFTGALAVTLVAVPDPQVEGSPAQNTLPCDDRSLSGVRRRCCWSGLLDLRLGTHGRVCPPGWAW